MRKNCLITRLFPFFIAAFLLNIQVIIANENRVTYDFRVTGIVSDENGPMDGVTITEKGTDNATTSNSRGVFTLNVKNANSILVVTSIGYTTLEVPVSGKSNISITLEKNAQELTGVVVTALGITREKKSLGYSVEEVAGKEMTRVAQENVLNAMSGKVAGVTINQTGAAGSSVSMVIRGATSLNSDNQPLFVIDGVPVANTINNVSQVGNDNRVDYGNAIASLNPDDIENVSILKGPSAAALYGSRAGNGVVLITTKSGKGLSKTTVNVFTNTVFDKPYRFLHWQYKYGPGLFSAIPEDVSGSPLTNPLGSLIDEGSVGLGGAELDKGYMAPQWNSPLDDNGKKIPIELKSYPDNVRNFVQTGITSTNGVSVANSNEKMNYRISYSNMQNRGIIPNSDLFRNTLNLNSSLKVTKRFTIGATLDLSRNNSNNRPASERGTNPLQWAYNVPTHVNILELKDYWEPGQEGIQQRTPRNGVLNNPWFLAYEVNNSFVRDRLYGNIKADWQIVKDLSLMLRYGLDTYNEERESKVPYSYTDDVRGAYGIINMKHFEGNADFLLTYKKMLGNFNVSVSGGGNMRRQNGSSVRNATITNTGLILPELYTLQNILPANLDFSSYRSKRGVNSLYAMASFDFKDMIYLDVTGRNDWSSTLLNAKPYFYPSASLSILANEILGITSSDINLIKLRGGYAQVGNDASPYNLFAVMGNGGTWGDLPRLTTSSALYNSNLKPELATSYEAGIDLSLFKNRFRVSATYYRVDNENQIFNTPLVSSGGYSSEIINAGLLRSQGYEISVGGTLVQSRNLRWDINANFTKNRTRIISLPEEMPFFTFWTDAKGGAWTYPGEEVGDIYGPEIRVVEDKSSPYYGYPLLQLDPVNGWATYAVAKEGQASRNKVGNFNPRFIMGFQNTISWKNWSLNFTLDWRNGGQFVSQTYRYGMSDGQALLPMMNAMDAGLMTGKELRDYLVANEDELIKGKSGYSGTIIGWPTPERTSFPIYYQTVLPYGGFIIPGVYATAWDANGNPTEYEENLGENVNPTGKPTTGSGTQPVPYAAAINWDLIQPTLFSASYLKLREVSITYGLPSNLIKQLRIQDASFSLYSRNLILWTAAKINIDPENAFQPSTGAQAGTQLRQGIERYNVTPWVIPVGIKLNLTF